MWEWLYRWAASPPAHWVIEFRGKYWDGHKFKADREAAKPFKTGRDAWAYIDGNFRQSTAEGCGLEKVHTFP